MMDYPWDDEDDMSDGRHGALPDPAVPVAGSVAAPWAAGKPREDSPPRTETAGHDPAEQPGPAAAESRLRTAGNRSSSGGGRPGGLPSGDVRAYRLARRLTDRDRAIVRAVARLGVLTSEQIDAMFFDSIKRAQKRLVALHRMGLLDRFQPYRPAGAASFHYVLGRDGAALVAAEDGDDPEAAVRRRRTGRGLALARTQRLAHHVGTNWFHAGLVADARRSPGAELEDWMTEPECTRWSEGIVRPDAWGRWREGGHAVEFFVEWDRGTEPLRRLVAKLAGYEALEADRGAVAWVLFVLHSARRERNVREALAEATVPVATAAADGGRLHAAEAVWLPLLFHSGPRLRLAGLAQVPVPPEAEARAREGSGRAWRYRRPADDEAGEAW